MLQRAALLLPLIALAGCVTTPESRSVWVGEVDENLLEMHGQTVFVHGYVWGCEPRAPCGLGDQPPRDLLEANLTFAYDTEFAEMLAKARGYKVLVEAEVNATCRMPQSICTGTPGELKPKRFIRAY